MLKITHNNDGRITTFKLEGRLVGEWVKELKNCWRLEMISGGATSVRIDLGGVTWVSDDGKALLAAMHREGVELLASNLVTDGILAELESA